MFPEFAQKWKFRICQERCRVYDPWNLEIDITELVRSGENRLEIEFPDAAEWSGLTSMIYVKCSVFDKR